MIPKARTLITWADIDQTLARFDEGNTLRDAKIAEMTAAGRTDGFIATLSGVAHERHWIDATAAQEYVTFITNLSVSGKLPALIKAEVLDYDAAVEGPPQVV
jgi:hypothetical protein